MVDPLNYFSFQPVLQDRCNRARGMCYHVCVMVDIKEPLLLIGNSSLCSGFNVLPHSQFFFLKLLVIRSEISFISKYRMECKPENI